ncbi:MAG TPA: hypothetical protein VHU85_09700 [Acidimicrobiales bacterium]|jgi:hypothetical protein|nr:hypothetical protein [Acidimicrobiales bacterium]
MFKSLLKWTVRLTVVAAVAAGVARLLGSRSGSTGTSGPIATIGGDTWPPVPVNPDRQA